MAFTDVGPEFGGEELLQQYNRTTLPATRGEAMKASFFSGTPRTITGRVFSEIQDKLDREVNDKTVLEPEELNKVFGQFIDVPFSKAMPLSLARRVVEENREEMQRRAVIALGPQDFLQVGSQLNIDPSDFSSFLSGAGTIASLPGNLTKTLINLVGLNPLAENSLSLLEDAILTKGLSKVISGSSAVLSSALRNGTRGEALASRIDKVGDFLSKRDTPGQTLRSNLTLGLPIAVAQAGASISQQQRLQRETDSLSEFTNALGMVIGMSGARYGVGKAFERLGHNGYSKALTKGVDDVSDGRSPIADSFIKKSVRTRLPDTTEYSFRNLDVNTFKEGTFYSSSTRRNILKETGNVIDKDFGNGLYVTDARSVADGVASHNFTGKKGLVHQIDMKDMKFIDADAALKTDMIRNINEDNPAVKAKEGDTLSSLFEDVKTRIKTKKLKEQDAPIEGVNKTLERLGFDGIKFKGGDGHLDIAPDVKPSLHNSALIFSASKKAKKMKSEIIESRDVTQRTEIKPDELQRAIEDETSRQNELGYSDDVKRTDDAYDASPEKANIDDASQTRDLQTVEDLVLPELEASLESVPKEVKKFAESSVEAIKNNKKLSEAESKLIDAILACEGI